MLMPSAQQLATLAIYLAMAVVIGAAGSAAWLGSKRLASSHSGLLRWATLIGAVVTGLAHIAALWLQAAAMADVPLAEAGPAALTVLTATHFGTAWLVGAVALAAVAVLAPRCGSRAAGASLACALTVFLYSRSMVSHAAGNGDLSWAVAVEWLHLLFASLWAGPVLVAATIILGGPARSAAERTGRILYIHALSAAATIALSGILLTGLASAWRNLGAIGNLAGNPYANTLLAKLALVALAAALGGANRWLVMPALAGDGADAALRRFTLVLRVEAVVLVGVLAMAALLGATPPPTDFPSPG
jgi:putative copper resistance protein D